MHPWICHLLRSMSLSVVAVGQKSRLLFLVFFPDPMLMPLSSQSSKGKESWKFSFETFSPLVLGRCWERILCCVCDRGSLIKKSKNINLMLLLASDLAFFSDAIHTYTICMYMIHIHINSIIGVSPSDSLIWLLAMSYPLLPECVGRIKFPGACKTNMYLHKNIWKSRMILHILFHYAIYLF